MRRTEIAVLRLARVCYEAMFDDMFEHLSPNSLDRDHAILVGKAAYEEMKQMAKEYSLFGSIRER